MIKYCTYLRVSTQRQGAQGLGIEAQRKMCSDFIAANKGEHVKEFMDVESGTHRDRKGLWDAINYCNKNKYPLVIATLSRLARDVEFCFRVINTGIEIHFTDMPVVNSMILGVFASVAQYEREMISARTKRALAVKKAQGAKLGAASEKYKETMSKKSSEEIRQTAKKRGAVMRKRFASQKDTQVFVKVLRRAFPDACEAENPKYWAWGNINTRGHNKVVVLGAMRDLHDFDNNIFADWDFDNMNFADMQRKLSGRIYALRRSYLPS